jgi:hypothetical protein
MKTIKYYQISGFQLFVMAIIVGVISAALITINTAVQEYLQLPMVHMSKDGQCTVVSNYKNGDAFTCNDVDVILRKYRTTKQE